MHHPFENAPEIDQTRLLDTEFEFDVSVIGLGYVGLPLAKAFAEAGLTVFGHDTSEGRVNLLRRGKVYTLAPVDNAVLRLLQSGQLTISTDAASLTKSRAIIICVPTPLAKDRSPDLSFVKNALASATDNLKRGQIIILESTVYPGVTGDILKPALERTGWKVGEDVFLAYSPERENPGNPDFSVRNIPKVVGADDPHSERIAVALYRKIVDQIVVVTSSKTAEATKLLENAYRAVNISFINEVRIGFGALGLDVWEVIKAASTKPFGFTPFYPGPGFGGHCIPVDPLYLAWSVNGAGARSDMIETADDVNQRTKDYIVETCQSETWRRLGINLAQASVLVVGLTYKKNVPDIRESAALDIFQRLLKLSLNCSWIDPWIDHSTIEPKVVSAMGRESKSSKELHDYYDVSVILVNHDNLDIASVIERSGIVLDFCNATFGVAQDKITRF